MLLVKSQTAPKIKL